MDGTDAAFHVWWDDDAQLAHVDWKPGSICGLTEAQEITAQVRALDHGTVPLLVDMRGLLKLERPAREYFVADRDVACAVALLVDSAVSKMIANFFIGMRRVPVPARLFIDPADALEWLGGHR